MATGHKDWYQQCIMNVKYGDTYIEQAGSEDGKVETETVVKDPVTGDKLAVTSEGRTESIMLGSYEATHKTVSVDGGGRIVNVIRDPEEERYLSIHEDGGVKIDDGGKVLSVGKKPSDAVQVLADNTVEEEDVLLYTVPEGKTLYITSCWMQVKNAANASVYGMLYVNDDGGAYHALLGYVELAEVTVGDLPTLHAELPVSFPISLEFPEGYKIRLYSSDEGASVTGSIYGYVR